MTLIYLFGIYRGSGERCSEREKPSEKAEKAVKPIPSNPRFLHYLWLLATEILNYAAGCVLWLVCSASFVLFMNICALSLEHRTMRGDGCYGCKSY